MSLQAIRRSAPKATFGALIRLFSNVSMHVLLQARNLCTFITAMITAEGFLPKVGEHVRL